MDTRKSEARAPAVVGARDLDAPLVPSTYVARWVDFLVGRGLPRAAVLAGTGLTRELLENPLSRFTFRSVGAVLWNGATLAGDPAIGFEFGLQLNAASHGWLGIALITAPSLGDAIIVGERYMNLRSYPWQVRMRIEGDVAIMQFEEAFSLGPIRPILLHIFFGGIIALAEFMMEEPLSRTDHEFTSEFVPDPAFVARFRDRLPRIRDGIGGNAVRFARAWLDKPMRWSDPVAHREAVAMLDEQQRMLLAGGPLPDRVRGVFTEALSPLPSAAAVAAQLGMSLRSLSRRLQEHGTSFQALRDEARRIRGLRLLQSTAEPVEAIAAALGYANAAGFHRAFRRWTGVSPGDYRDGARSAEADGPLRR